MLNKEIRDAIRDLMNREILPAIGCTEPAAVALAVAKATETLGERPQKIEVRLSGNVLKNAMGVGIPGTGMVGLPIAIALGSLIGKSEYGLEVLKDVNVGAVELGRKMIDDGIISIGLKEDSPSNLYIEVVALGKNNVAETRINGDHTHFVLVRKNSEILFEEAVEKDLNANDSRSDIELNLKTVWDYATLSPIDELIFILEARKLNTEAAKLALYGKGKGHKVGKTINESKELLGSTVIGKMLAMTSAACDARMAGEPIPVMSNSGSGNQGIAITMPVVSYAEEIGASEEKTTRALILAHLTSIYIKQSLGRLSALCGCVVASTGAALAITYLMGGSYMQGTYAVKNMIATLTGMICDGAKPACSLKIASGVGTAYIAAMMAMHDECVTSTEGIIENSVDETIRNFCTIGRDAMLETDRTVLKIMSGA